jgi:hypothetical protein
VTKSAIAQLRTTAQARVLASTAHDVATLYDACWWRTPPGHYQARSERYAAARGWIEPWRWDGLNVDDPATLPHGEDMVDVDAVAVAETILGRRVPLTRAERRQVVEVMQRRGATSAEIAERLGCSARTVDRYEAALLPLRDVA